MKSFGALARVSSREQEREGFSLEVQSETQGESTSWALDRRWRSLSVASLPNPECLREHAGPHGAADARQYGAAVPNASKRLRPSFPGKSMSCLLVYLCFLLFESKSLNPWRDSILPDNEKRGRQDNQKSHGPTLLPARLLATSRTPLEKRRSPARVCCVGAERYLM